MSDLEIQGPQYDSREGFAIVEEDRWLVTGLDEEQAVYALMILENDGLGDLDGLDAADIDFLLRAAVERVESPHDGTIVFAAETREWAH